MEASLSVDEGRRGKSNDDNERSEVKGGEDDESKTESMTTDPRDGKWFVKGKFLEDDASEVCLSCGVMFSIFRRRHHCRRCGGLYCHSCSDTYLPLESIEPAKEEHTTEETVRVCTPCVWYVRKAEVDGIERRNETLCILGATGQLGVQLIKQVNLSFLR